MRSYVIDSKREEIAVHEARKLRIPVIGIVDTNCDPDEVDYVIPGNDDALRAIKLFTSRLADAIISGREMKESAKSDDGGERGDAKPAVPDKEPPGGEVKETGADPGQLAPPPA